MPARLMIGLPRLFAFLIVCFASVAIVYGAEHTGSVTFNGVPVPGASITAVRGDQRKSVHSARDGSYRFPDLADGPWTIQIEMRGFQPASREIVVAAGQPGEQWTLSLESFEAMARAATPQAPAQVGLPSGTAPPSGAARTPPRPASTPATPAAPAASDQPRPAPAGDDPIATAARNFNAADGFLINGSVNNGAASPFAQMAAFGNNRRGQRSLYNGNLGILFGNSSFDAAPFSFSNRQLPSPSYDDVQILGAFNGPIRIPRLGRNGPTVQVGYQRVVDHNATTQSVRMPTIAERRGDFSGTLNAQGNPVQIVDPASGLPFQDNRIPDERITPEARALLNLYPNPNTAGEDRFNYQTPVLSTRHTDAVQTRATQSIGRRDSLAGSVSYLRSNIESQNAFGFVDENLVANTDALLNWTHRFNQFLTLRGRYQYTRQANDGTPYFSGVTNISGLAGITGNNQEAVNWGPPALTFSSGLAGLSSGQYARNTNRLHNWSSEMIRSLGRHTMTVGGGLVRQEYDVLSQQNARGTFGFTGALSGSDFGDFLLGLPSTSAIAFGNADKTLHGISSNLYMVDDWRVSPSLTLNIGLRWEYESPMTEEQGRLVNLDVAPNFTSAVPVLGTNLPATPGDVWTEALIRGDHGGLQPRIGSAWRPVPGSSLVIRAGYGIYRNINVYPSLALLLAQQPPFSKTSSVTRSATNQLTLSNGFLAPLGTANTFAVDPDFKVGYAHTWQVSAQRDLPASLTMIGTYTGTAGRHLMQEFLPNTYPAGAVNPCPTCPSGFVYLTSNATSLRNAGQIQVRRRLRSGLSASLQYTLAKATDNASAFVPTGGMEGLSSGLGMPGATIAQDWLNLNGEFGPSSFDQRHLVVAEFQYTTGQGIAGGALLTGLKGRLFKGWTITSQLTTGSGLPQTPLYLAPVGSTGVSGTIRGSLTGQPTDPASSDSYANPAAFTAPASGQWGNAGRNSLRGPAQFSLNAGVGRSFLLGERYSIDWRLDATNLLNRVTYSGFDAVVGSPQFGLANRANTMRKIQMSARLRF